MAKTPEQVLREIVAAQVFQIAQLISQIDNFNEKIQNLTPKRKKKESLDGRKQDI
jgi:hypothetical protein